MDEYKRLHYFEQIKCPVCGKKFIPAPQHVYKDKRSRRRVCSWHCVCESERLKEATQKRTSRKRVK